MSLPRVTLRVPPLHNTPQNWPIHATYPEDTIEGGAWVDDPLYGRAAIVQDYMTENDPSYGVYHPWNSPPERRGRVGRYDTLAEAIEALRAAGYEIDMGAPYLPDVRIGVDSWGAAYFENAPGVFDDLAAWDAPGGARVCRPSPDDEALDALVDRSVPLIMDVGSFEEALQVLRDRGHRVLDGGGK